LNTSISLDISGHHAFPQAFNSEGAMMRFSFGKNWQSYSKYAITTARIEQARQTFRELITGIDIKGKKFIDIGFGQGLSLIAAAEMNADVLGVDLDSDNVEALDHISRVMGFPKPIKTLIVSILDDGFVDQGRGRYDIVHSWGVLHHTGQMKKAIDNACALVAEGGVFICAIYNRHWSSPLWKVIKWSYNRFPESIQKIMIALFYPILYMAKYIVTLKNPKKKERGMDFFHDVVDWVGGYPYEYAGMQEIRDYVCDHGFECVKMRAAQVPTGCNEFMFKRISGPEKIIAVSKLS
jgi:SAM-dependent methyltransferase